MMEEKVKDSVGRGCDVPKAPQMTGKCGTEGQNNAQDTFKKVVTSDKANARL